MGACPASELLPPASFAGKARSHRKCFPGTGRSNRGLWELALQANCFTRFFRGQGPLPQTSLAGKESRCWGPLSANESAAPPDRRPVGGRLRRATLEQTVGACLQANCFTPAISRARPAPPESASRVLDARTGACGSLPCKRTASPASFAGRARSHRLHWLVRSLAVGGRFQPTNLPRRPTEGLWEAGSAGRLSSRLWEPACRRTASPSYFAGKARSHRRLLQSPASGLRQKCG